MTPADLELAIEVNRRLLRRRTFNEETLRSDYHPPLTDQELGALLKSEEQIYSALVFKERIYADSPETERGNWREAIRNLYEHLNSKIYQDAARDVLRTKYDLGQTPSQDNPGAQPPTT